MPTSYVVRIGNITLRDEVISVSVKEEWVDHGRDVHGRVTLHLEKVDPSRLNLFWPAIVDEVDGNESRRILWGVVLSISREKDAITLECGGSERYSKEYLTTDSFFNFPIQEIVFYLGRRIREIETQEKNIHGLALNKTRRRFNVIMPISGIEVYERVSIQDAELHPADPSSEDERLISEYKQREKMWDVRSRLNLNIEATYFDEAAEEARKAAIAVLDWLSYSLKLSLLGSKVSREVSLVPWIRDRSLSKVSVGDQAYVKDMTESPTKACMFDFRTVKVEPIAKLADEDWQFYGSLRKTIETTKTKHDEGTPNLPLAIHWLRRGRESIDTRDRLVDLWIALEFLIASQDPPTLCTAQAVNSLSETLKFATEILQVAKGKQIVDRFRNAVTTPSLRERFDTFVKSFSVTIEESEYEAVWKRLRDARNALEHGRVSQVDANDLDVMEQMIAKMVWVAANSKALVSNIAAT